MEYRKIRFDTVVNGTSRHYFILYHFKIVSFNLEEKMWDIIYVFISSIYNTAHKRGNSILLTKNELTLGFDAGLF